MKRTFLFLMLMLALAADSLAQSSVYVGGHIRRQRPATIDTLRNSGFRTVILFNVSIEPDGSLVTDLNNEKGGIICKDGQYTFGQYQPDYANDVKLLKTAPTGVDRIEICIGGWGNPSYTRIRDFIRLEGTGPTSTLYRNFKALKEAIPEIDAVNNDDEQSYDLATAVQFHVMMADLGYKSSLAPYMNKTFWQQLATQVNEQRPGTVDRIMIQCYDGGANNQPRDWHIGDIPLHAGRTNYQTDMTTSINQMRTWKQNQSVVGGFVWVYNDETWPLGNWAVQMNRIFPMEQPADGVVTIYTGKNYTGHSFTLPLGEWGTGPLRARGFSPQGIGSIKVPQGYQVTAYQGQNFSQRRRYYTEDNPDVLGLISSLAIERTADDVQTEVTIEAGKTYRIALAANPQKSLFVRNAVTDNLAPIVLWTETDVPAQQWTAEVGDDGRFAFKNVYTGKYLNYASGTLSQYTGKSWWTLEPVGLNGSICYMKRATNYLHVNATADDSEPTLGEAQAWEFVEVEPQAELNEAIRQRMADGFLRQYMQDKGTGYRTFVNGGWSESETQEALLDMYEATGDRRYLSIYEACYNYFKYHVGQTWTGGTQVGGYSWFGYSFNDDVMWQIIGAARAYLLTGNSVYINDAKRNFDLIWNRAYLGYVGLLRWAEQDGDRNSTNSCVNGPAEVAACYIALGTGDESYFEKAKLLYANQRTYLANMSTGQVYDSAIFDPATGEVKNRNTWASTYNQGTMLGAAVMLYQHYGDEQYRKDADKIISYSRSNLCDASGIIKVCQNANGDFQGFKGILMRYAGLYVRTFGVSRYDTWLKNNAMRAYNNMNSRSFGHSAWLTKAAENLKFGDVDYSNQAFGASTALSAAFATSLPPTEGGEPQTAEQTKAEAKSSLFTFNAPLSGHYRLTVYYKATSRQTVYLTVNDGDAVSRAYTVTGNYTGQRPYFVTLHEGYNTMTLTTSNGDLPTIDRIEVRFLAPVSNSLEAEHAVTHGQAVISNDGDASGGQYVGFIGGGSSNYVTFYYDAEDAADYDLDITYFTAETRQMYVRLNNGAMTMYSFDNTGSYNANTARMKTVRVSLKTGTNTITLGNDSGWSPNVDKIALRRIDDSSAIAPMFINNKDEVNKDNVYTLQGIRIAPRAAANRGIYIIGNKKVINN